MFQEQTSKVVLQAKTELDSVLQQIINAKGIEALKEQSGSNLIENK